MLRRVDGSILLRQWLIHHCLVLLRSESGDETGLVAKDAAAFDDVTHGTSHLSRISYLQRSIDWRTSFWSDSSNLSGAPESSREKACVRRLGPCPSRKPRLAIDRQLGTARSLAAGANT